MNDSNFLIRCENVSKIFCRDLKKSLWYGVRASAADLFPRKKREARDKNADSSSSVSLRQGEFWANKDINFSIKRGECLGLVGRNGAGKTTLLKMLSGLIKPDSGSIEMRGRIGGLIALGSGFNPILTGRENIAVNASILGLSRQQTKAKLEEIVDFAEVESSIDAPVKTYSSGMQVRLGFAIAAVLIKPDVLLLDEVLAVGDVGFRVKCYNRISELLAQSAVIFVSHNRIEVARICTQLLALKDGRTWFTDDSVSSGLLRYEEGTTDNESIIDTFGENLIKVTNFKETTKANTTEIRLALDTSSAILESHLLLTLWQPGNEPAAQIHIGKIAEIPKGESVWLIVSPTPPLRSGTYLVVVSFHDSDSSRSELIARNRGIYKWEIPRVREFEFATTVLQANIRSIRDYRE